MAKFEVDVSVNGQAKIGGLSNALLQADVSAAKSANSLRKLQEASKKASDDVERLKKAQDGTTKSAEELAKAEAKLAEANNKVSIATKENIIAQNKLTEANRKASNEMNNSSKNTDMLSGAMGKLSAVIGLIGFTALASKAIQTSDAMNNLQARIKLVSGESANLAGIQKSLLTIANENKVSLDSVGKLYVKLADPIGKLGGSLRTTLDITSSFSKALLVSGASTEEATSATLQFAQAMGSGVLRGDEFNSIAENSPRLLKAVADSLGVTTGALRDMAADGKLTAGIVGGALLRSMTDLEAEARQMPHTVSGAFQILKNNLSDAISKFDDATGSSGMLADAITELSSGTGSFTDDLISNSRAMSAWINTHKEGISQLETIGQKAIGVMGKLSQVVAANVGTNISTGAKLLGKAQDFFTPQSVKDDRTFVANINAHAEALQRRLKIEKEEAEIAKQIAEQSKFMSASDKAKATEEEKRTASLLKAKKSLIAIGLTEVEVNQKMVSITKQYDRNIADAKALEAKSKQVELDKLSVEQRKKALIEQERENKRIKAQKDRDDKQKEDQEKRASQKLIEETEKTEDQIFKLTHGTYENKLRDIANETTAKLKSGQDTVMIAEWASQSVISLDDETAKELKKTNEERIKKEMEDAKKLSEMRQKEFEERNKFWIDMFDGIEKAMDKQIFDTMTGKWDKFGNWLKDFWSSLTTSIARSASSMLSNSLIGGLKSMIIGNASGGSSLLAGLGLSAGSVLQGVTTDSAGFTTTAGGTVYDAAGQITKAGSDNLGNVGDIVSTASSINTAYQVLTGGLAAIGANIATGFQYLAGGAQALGLTGTAAGISNFGIGAGSVFTGGEFAGMGAMGAGQLLGGAGVGALGGYALGSIGDKLFGANTKAGVGGAIGGGIGGVAGTIILPGVGTAIGAGIGAALGSVIGGMFGKTKVTGSGIQAFSDINTESGAGAISSFIDYNKKSWFKSRSWTEYTGLSEKESKSIMAIFTTYDYLLGQLGGVDDIIVRAGKYSGTSFFNEIDKAFIRAFIDNKSLTDTFYNSWSELAGKMGVAIQEAFSTTITNFLQYKRGFEVYTLERSGNTLESLKLQSEWAKKDLNAVESLIGTNGVTLENYIDKYNQAVKGSFTPETIQQWQSLGDALKNAANSSDAYTKAIEAQNEAQKQANQALQASRVTALQLARAVSFGAHRTYGTMPTNNTTYTPTIYTGNSTTVNATATSTDTNTAVVNTNLSIMEAMNSMNQEIIKLNQLMRAVTNGNAIIVEVA